MKTTLEIPDEIFREAIERAALYNIPLRQFVTEAVEEFEFVDREDEA